MPAKAGKKVGQAIYIHLPAILSPFSCLTKTQSWDWFCAQMWLPRGYDYDMVCIEPHRVRFLQMSDLWDAHPHVVMSWVVTWGLNQKVCKLTAGAINGQIYHRMETMLHPESKYYPFHCAVTAHELSIGALGPFKIHGKTPSGHLEIWKRQLQSKGINYGKMMKHIEKLEEQHGRNAASDS